MQPDPGAGESGGSSGGDSGTNDESGTVVTVVVVMAVLVFLVVLGAVIFVSLHKAKAVTGAGGRATENPVYAAGAAPGAISIDSRPPAPAPQPHAHRGNLAPVH